MAAALRFNNLKIAASEQAPRVCQGALGVCGIVGFKNDTPFSVGRHLRDTMSACLMVANERIHQTNAEPAADRQGRLSVAEFRAGDRPSRRRSSTSCVDAGLLDRERRARASTGAAPRVRGRPARASTRLVDRVAAADDGAERAALPAAAAARPARGDRLSAVLPAPRRARSSPSTATRREAHEQDEPRRAATRTGASSRR